MKRKLELYTIQRIVSPIAAKFGVERVYAFGSYARGDATPASDLDLRIEKGNIRTLVQLIGFRQALEEKMPVSVDIVTSDIADKEFLKAIMKDEVVIYER